MTTVEEVSQRIVDSIELRGDGEGGYWVDNRDELIKMISAAFRAYGDGILEKASEELTKRAEIVRSLKGKELV
jgi:hypothetical protein